jgi:acyl-CoA thioester hydrolase
MSTPFIKHFVAGWGDMDFNSHMRNTAYLDYSATVRMMYFNENGFSADKFRQLQFGPHVFEDRVSYFKEVHLIEPFSVRLLVDGLRADGSRFRLINEFFSDAKGKIATVVSSGAWLNLRERKLMPPPEEMLQAMSKLEKSPQFQEF